MKYTLLDDNNGRGLVKVRDRYDNDFWILREKYEASLKKVEQKKVQREKQ